MNSSCAEDAPRLAAGSFTEYFDHSILAEEFGSEMEPNYCEPSELESVILALMSAIKEGKSVKLKRNLVL